MAVYAAAVDALTRRLLELELARRPAPEHRVRLARALGSQARRESLPASDVDSALVWFGPDDATALRARLVDLGAGRVRRPAARAGCASMSTAPARPSRRSCARWTRGSG